MEASIDSTTLKAALALVLKAVPARPTHPILANVLVSFEDDTCRLTAFDLSLGISTTIGAAVVEDGSFTVSGRLFADVVGKIDGMIALSADFDEKNLLEITSLTGGYEIRTMSSEEYPALPATDESFKLHIDSDRLIEGIRHTLFTTSTDETKQVLTGVCISKGDKGKCLDPDSLAFGATDGHRLAAVEMVTPCGELDSFSISVPRSSLAEVLKLASVTPAVEIQVDGDGLIAEFSSQDQATKIVTRLLDGSFPNYSQLIPQQFTTTATIDRLSLLNALERVAVIAERKNNVVKMQFSSLQSLTISVDAADVGSAKEMLSLQVSGEKELTIAFNVKYLLESLRNLQSHEVQLRLNTPISPVIISPLGGAIVTHLIMPVQSRD